MPEDPIKAMQISPTDYITTFAPALEQWGKEMAQRQQKITDILTQAFAPLAERSAISLRVAIRQINRALTIPEPKLERQRRAKRREARIEREEIRAARKVRRRKPKLWAGETLAEYRHEQMLHWRWKPTQPFRMITGSLRFPETARADDMMAAFGIVDDPAED